MLYLFNSAFRTRYKTNILNTLFLPKGFDNEYRYRNSGDTTNIAPEIFAQGDGSIKNKDAIIIAIDRYHPSGFFFVPCRLATYISLNKNGEQMFFRVVLKDYIYPKNIDEFQNRLREAITSPLLPAPIGSDPELRLQGYFAQNAANIFSDPAHFYFGQDAWERCVDRISQMQAYGNGTSEKVVFSRVELHNERHINCLPKLDGTAYFPLVKDRRYILNYYYRFPIQNHQQDASVLCRVDPSDLIRTESAEQFSIDTFSSKAEIVLKVRKYLDANASSIKFNYSSKTATGSQDVSPTVAEEGLEFRVSDSKLFWPSVLILLTLYVIVTTLIGTDFSKVFVPNGPPLVEQLWEYVKSLPFVVKASAAFIQAIILLGFLWLFGKKIT